MDLQRLLFAVTLPDPGATEVNRTFPGEEDSNHTSQGQISRRQSAPLRWDVKDHGVS